MKKNLLLAFLISSGILVFAQKQEYITRLNIPYYRDFINKSDPYINVRCVLDMYYPEKAKGFSTIIWFHGGGLTAGYKEIPQALKEKGFCVVGVNYRLYPKVKAPAYIEDAAAAVAWVFQNIKNFGGDSTLIFLSGHSAGGYLSLMVGLDMKWLKKYDIDANRIAGLIPLSGQAITHFTVRNERGIPETQPVIDDLAPLYHVRADAPPLLLITGDREMELLGRYEENAYLARMMKIAGHNQTRLIELGGYGHTMTEPAFPLLVKEVLRLVEEKKK
ncbi:MAG: alpha/beta hydrolase [Bacteroidales bacterium]|nr:alpha/beta hydrolase [Bacteroidales bacterium]